MDSRPKSSSRYRTPSPLNRVYRDTPTEKQEDTLPEYVDIRVRFFLSSNIDTLRWVYCWAGSPLQHCQVEIDGLICNIDSDVSSHWVCKDLWIGHGYTLCKELVFKVPRNEIDWGRIQAVSLGHRIKGFRLMLWGIAQFGWLKRRLPKPSADCVSVSKQILGTFGITTSGCLPIEFYKSLKDNYNCEEISHRSLQ